MALITEKKHAFLWIGVFGLFALMVVLYLLRLHYVQDYSDPVGFLSRAVRWGQGLDTADRAPLYPVILYYIMRAIGRDWVFVANIPFILMFLGLMGALSYCVFTEKSEHRWSGNYLCLAAIMSAAVFFVLRRHLLLQMVNPYREPLSFSLLLLSVWLIVNGWRRKKILRLFLAGITVGICVSLRETSLLIVFSIGLWLMGEAYCERRIRWNYWFVIALGIVLGLLPLMYKNYSYSGQALVPAYSAGRVEAYSATGHWDIPVPGMSLRYFRHTAPATLRKTMEIYTPVGAFLFFAGLVAAVKKRNRLILLLLLPSCILFFLFHFFYNRYLARYIMTGELFAVLIMVYGAFALWNMAEALLEPRIGRKLQFVRIAVLVFMVLHFFAVLAPPLISGNRRTKVWNLETIRSEILAVIDTPATFMGNRHFCYRMSWLLDQEFYEYTHNFHWDQTACESFEERLALFGAETIEEFRTGNYYIDESDFSVARNWLERTPVFDFSQLSVPFERYGQQITGTLYNVSLWRNNSVSLKSETPRPQNVVLMLDLGRPWDYPDRDYLTGHESGGDFAYPLTNALQFVALAQHESTEPFEFIIDSNQPLSPDPYWRLIEMNEDVRISFGMAAEQWGWNLVSERLFQHRRMARDAVHLYDQGAVHIPVFAAPDHDVYAEFRVEFRQEHEYWRTRRHQITIEWDGDTASFNLPRRRRMGHFTVLLGKGEGRLSWRSFDLQTTLPSYGEQSTPEFSIMRRGYGYVKLYDVLIRAVPIETQYPVVVNIGVPGDERFIDDGFYGREESGGQTVRWSKPRAVLRARLPATDGKLAVEWRIVPIRPGLEALRPVFAVNASPIPDGDIDVSQQNGLLVYRYPLAPSQIKHGDWNVFSLNVPSFNPARDIESKDTRDLGLFVESVVIDRL